jgi:hypothetical protein
MLHHRQRSDRAFARAATGTFRFERFMDRSDFLRGLIGAALMGGRPYVNFIFQEGQKPRIFPRVRELSGTPGMHAG